jgi:hypothetical protein
MNNYKFFENKVSLVNAQEQVKNMSAKVVPFLIKEKTTIKL